MEKHLQGWQLARTEAGGGTGNWRAFKLPMETVERAAEKWKAEVGKTDKLWLCWNINSRWCLLQQKLVREAGWTPVVGWDPNCGDGRPKELIPEAIPIDFNQDLELPVLFMHFPLEFAFLWCEKLAFWHSDFLLSRQQIATVSKRFEAIKDGEMEAVFSYGGMRNLLQRKKHRYFELLGCTTRGASRDQFEKGCGWWRHYANHINSPDDMTEKLKRQSYCCDHGGGIFYWEKFYGGKVHALKEREYAANHFSINTVKNYKKASDKSAEMDINFDLNKITLNLGLGDLV
jgi:hypothetical protein